MFEMFNVLVIRILSCYFSSKLNTERLSMTFTANGKNETFAVSLQLCVQYSEIMRNCNE